MLFINLIATALAVSQPAPPVATAAMVDARATLAVSGPARSLILDGRSWTCAPDGVCVARGAGASQPALRECRRFVARFGAVTRYERGGTTLSEAQLAQCNRALASGSAT